MKAKRANQPPASLPPIARDEATRRLRALRRLMAAERVDAVIVQATDRFLNEYVAAEGSERIWLSGFTGSAGDLLVTPDEAWLFVDGRYHEQAERELALPPWSIVKLELVTELYSELVARLVELARARSRPLRVGFDPETTSSAQYAQLRARLAGAGATLKTLTPSLVARARGGAPPLPAVAIEAVPHAAVGRQSDEKLAGLRRELARLGLDAWLVTRLDELAYLTNLRAYEMPFSATFRGLAYVDARRAAVFVEPAKLPDAIRRELKKSFDFEPEAGWNASVAERLRSHEGPSPRVGIDPEGTSQAVRQLLEEALAGRGSIEEQPSPLARFKAIKHPAELAALREHFARADEVMARVIAWLKRAVSRGEAVSEADLAERVERSFFEAGARSLSFRVIAASGANAAVIHYSRPDPRKRILADELVLIDTGAYFEGGYATDLTRTFLAGGKQGQASQEQRRIYTLVLKAAIQGMSARLPRGATGGQLDAIVRAPLWQAGLDFAHGTGHGIGILVHEFPPRVAKGSASPLEPGMVFSIEPGVYRPGWGGVRIENLVTLEPDPLSDGFMRVVPLSFAPLERELIDSRLLSPAERRWLAAYRKAA